VSRFFETVVVVVVVVVALSRAKAHVGMRGTKHP